MIHEALNLCARSERAGWRLSGYLMEDPTDD